jgi:hypothetical protein
VSRANGFGRVTPRAWQKSRVRSQVTTRDDLVDRDLEAAKFRRLAPVLGFCGACGVTVDEAAGRLHAHDCPYLPTERRRQA